MDTRTLSYSKGTDPHCQGQIYQEDGDGHTIALTYNDEEGRTAAEIAKRWNAYARLVDQVRLSIATDISHHSDLAAKGAQRLLDELGEEY